MWSRVHVVLVVAVLGVLAGVAVGQPAAETELDEFRTQLYRHLAHNEFRAALGVMDEMVLLQAERGAALPEEFPWQYAQVARSVGDTPVAIAALRHYLALAGPSGKHHKEARRMLDAIGTYAGFDCFFNSRWPTCPPTWSDLHAR